jgi:hypothetical protein
VGGVCSHQPSFAGHLIEKGGQGGSVGGSEGGENHLSLQGLAAGDLFFKLIFSIQPVT